jgi:hypothetical protein
MIAALVEMSGGQVGHLLEWRRATDHGTPGLAGCRRPAIRPRHRHKVVEVRAASLVPLEEPGAYQDVLRRVFGNDGRIRPWAPLGSGAPGQQG